MTFKDDYSEKIKAVGAREDALQATIQDELDELALERSRLLDAREEAIGDYLLSHEPSAFLYVDSARELYELGFDRGRGNKDFGVLYSALVKDSYVSDFAGWWTKRDEQFPVKSPTLVLENDWNSETLSKSIELLEKLYVTAREINSSVPIEVFGLARAHSISIKFIDDSWVVLSSVHGPQLFTAPSLAEAISEVIALNR